jgi:hypothetical protein
MRLVKKGGGWPHAVALVWAIVGMLVAPLVHIHPEADHHHGEVGHVHGGTIHTVWSPDLDCEFNNHQQVGGTENAEHDGAINFTQFAHLSDQHYEVGFSFLSDSTDRKHSKLILTQAFAVAHAAISDSDHSLRRKQYDTTGFSSIRFIHDLPSRAPPSLFL